MYVVYALVDPRDKVPFYIGISDDIYARFQQHLRCTGENFRKDAKIQEIKADNYMVIMETLEKVGSLESARPREAYWIHHYLHLRVTLCNHNLPSPTQYRVKRAKASIKKEVRHKAEQFALPVDEELIRNMVREGISRTDMIQTLWGYGATGGDAYKKSVIRLNHAIASLVRNPHSDMDEQTQRICAMLKEEQSTSKIIEEIWGINARQGGDAYKKAARELSDIMSSLV